MNTSTRSVREQFAELHARHPWKVRNIGGNTWQWLETAGRGQRVLLIPGAIGDGSMFLKTLQSLGEQLNLTALSYPDLSDPQQLADGLATLVEAEGWEPVVVVGSSYGAYWTQFFARDFTELVSALVLGNTFVAAGDVFDDPAAEEARMLESTGEQVHAQWLGRVQSTPPSELRDMQELMLTEVQSGDSLRTRMLGVARAVPAGPLREGSMKVITIETDDDPLIPPRARAALRSAYPHARHVRMDKGAHYPQVLNAAEYEQVLLEVANEAQHLDIQK